MSGEQSPGEMRVVRDSISLEELRSLAATMFGDFVKAVVDIERGIMAVGGELHSDGEALLIEDGSRRQDLWGINIYPAAKEEDRFEFDSMINIRPSQGNRSRGVDDPTTKAKILAAVARLVRR